MADYIPTPYELRTNAGPYGKYLKEVMAAAKLDPKHCMLHAPHEFFEQMPDTELFAKGILGMPVSGFSDPTITYFLVERKDGETVKVRFKAASYEERRPLRSQPDHVKPIYLDEHVEVCRMDRAGPGGASHKYEVFTADETLGSSLCRIHFQEGPVSEVGVNGVQEEALVAIVLDRLKAFQEHGQHTTAMAMAKLRLEEALLLMNTDKTD